MGLDMSLHGRRYLASYNQDDAQIQDKLRGHLPELQGVAWEDNPIREIMAEVGYWRKANQIHKWFVDNVQGGVDECRPHRVSRSDLEKLKSICLQVLDKPDLAAELLPTESGFFFGSLDYDDGYQADLHATVSIIERAMSLPQDWEFEYQSSW